MAGHAKLMGPIAWARAALRRVPPAEARLVWVDSGHSAYPVIEDPANPASLPAPCCYCQKTRHHTRRCLTCGAPPT